MKILNLKEAQDYLSTHIPENPGVLFPGGLGRKRTKYLLGLLGNPQEKLNVIHIAGTSGKSSTSYLLSLLLASQGIRTGLFISPHITDIRERIRVNDKNIEEDQFVSYLNEIIPFIEQVQETRFGPPTYFEILTVFAYYFFWRVDVQYAVMETGIGGLMDATNVVLNSGKVSVVTRLGMDHMEILGKTLGEIAEQKAGIINKSSYVFTPKQDLEAELVLKDFSKNKKAQLLVIQEGVNYKDIQEDKGRTLFSFKFLGTNLPDLSLGLLGKYQAENCSLALSVLVFISKRDGFVIDEKRIRAALERASFFGRLSKYKIGKKTVILDGAHNEQKMESFITALSHLYPKKRFHFLLAFKSTKDFLPILNLIIPKASKIIVTSFTIKTQDWIHKSVNPELVIKSLSSLGFYNYTIIKTPEKALEKLLKERDKVDLIITGSFYLISELWVSYGKKITNNGHS